MGTNMDYQAVIGYYYKEDTPLRKVLVAHSRAVAARALLICDRHPELGLDRGFLEAAAMLHDIGIIRCDAPGIHCHGTEPYICHGRLGGEMLRRVPQCFPEGNAEPYARVCERHTGAGLTRREILAQGLPLPLQDFLPETLEEQVVCYADKFYSKTHLDREKTVEQAARSLEKFGAEGVERFRRWARLFE